ARYIRPYRGSGIFASVLTIVVALLNIVTPYISGMIVDLVIQGGQDNLLLPLLFVMIAGTVFRTWLRYLYQIRFEYISQDVLFQIRVDLCSKFQVFDFSFFNRTRTGDIRARVTGDGDAIRVRVSWAYFNILDNVVLLVSALI